MMKEEGPERSSSPVLKFAVVQTCVAEKKPVSVKKSEDKLKQKEKPSPTSSDKLLPGPQAKPTKKEMIASGPRHRDEESEEDSGEEEEEEESEEEEADQEADEEEEEEEEEEDSLEEYVARIHWHHITNRNIYFVRGVFLVAMGVLCEPTHNLICRDEEEDEDESEEEEEHFEPQVNFEAVRMNIGKAKNLYVTCTSLWSTGTV